MAFESINVSSLRNALNSCKSTINYNESKNIIENINDPNCWSANSKKNLNNALLKLKNERYKKLEELINNYISVTNYIQEYQNIAGDNKNLFSEYSSLQGRLYYSESYPVKTTDKHGKTVTTTSWRTVKNYSVERQMNRINQTMINNRNRMDELEKRVSNSI